MTTARLFRPRSGVHADPLAGRLLAAYLLSLLLHGLLLFGLTGSWWGGAPRGDRPPVYYVDLVHKPVRNPQAGRPEPRMSKPPAPVPAAMATKSPAKPAPSATAAVSSKAPDRVKQALTRMREEQALQEKFAAMRQNQAVAADVPVGLPDARGSEAGVSSLAYIQAFIQQNWALSPYLLADRARMAQIEAWVVLTYSRSGQLERYRFEKPSRDPQFDESIKRALIKSKQLPATLPAAIEDVRVTFNLKTMTEAPR